MKTTAKEKKRLLDFLDNSPTAYNAAAHIESELEKAGFSRLSENGRWKVQPGGKYYVSRNHSSVISFIMPHIPDRNMPARILVSHLDSPALRLKLRGYKKTCGVNVVPVEMYGGAISSTWLDRPLGIAGLLVNSGDDLGVSVFDRKNAAVIPNLAVHHLSSDSKNGISYNTQTQLGACIGVDGTEEIDKALGISPDAIEDSELNLYDCTPASLLGTDGKLLSAPRLDNMLAAFTSLEAMMSMDAREKGLALSFFADNEEIGSKTRQGADSDFLLSVLTRIVFALGGDEEDVRVMLAGSYLVSNDAAHALHPGYAECYERDYAPQLGGGVVIKKNVNHRYISNGGDNAIFRRLCRRGGIPCQVFTNRADRPCGSTVGSMLSTRLGVRGVDIGIAMFAMHSIRETAAVDDVFACREASKVFLSDPEDIPFL